MKRLKYFISGFIILSFFCSAAAADSLLVVNSSVSQTSIAKDDVKLIFLGKKRKWDNGDRIRVCALKSGNTHEAFLDKYVDKTPSKFTSFWRIALVSGTAYPPKFVESEAELVEYVRNEEGAVGYISSGTPHEGVKVLPIQ